MESKFIAIDLGASSGRIILSYIKDGNAHLEEIHRFTNYLYNSNNYLHWDFSIIYDEIIIGLNKTFEKYSNIVSIGIDTFGVDFGLLDEQKKLIKNPYSYRNNFGDLIKSSVDQKINPFSLYKKTGIQYMPFNSLHQLFYLREHLNENFNQVVLLPDLIAYKLTGNLRTEKTNFSTTNLMDINNKKMIKEASCFNILENLFPKFINAGESYGYLKKELNKTSNDIDVIAVCSHDTASAVLATRLDNDSLFLSSGTWSLLGTKVNAPLVSKEAYNSGYSNELGFNNSFYFLNNIMGLWIFNNVLKTYLKETNKTISNVDLLLKDEPLFNSFIDVDHESFVNPSNMIHAIQDYCRKTNQVIPNTISEIIMVIFQSLAYKYKNKIDELEKITNKFYEKIVIVGGGSNIKVLNQMIASSTGKIVEKGIEEATAVGNILVQMKAKNIINSVESGLDLYLPSNKNIFYPQDKESYDTYYKHYTVILNYPF